MGKGAALKTGINWILLQRKIATTIITADADGQHSSRDILKISALAKIHPESLIIGARSFDNQAVPLRSRFGNQLTRLILQLVSGISLADTQSGLRAFPIQFSAELLSLTANRYEFELDMLLRAHREKVSIVECPIETIYLNQNASSHFNPLIDSAKIYFTLLRFMIVAFLTGSVDLLLFYTGLHAGFSMLTSQIIARGGAMILNYLAVKTVVFHSKDKHNMAIPKYVFLVFFSGFVSFSLMNFLYYSWGISVLYAKVFAESILFLGNFLIQRDLIFYKRKSSPVHTDWDRYYDRPYKTATITRKITEHRLVNVIKKYLTHSSQVNPSIVEMGGANSFFFEGINLQVHPECYKIIDNNEIGLKKFALRFDRSNVILSNQDVLNIKADPMSDIVFSVGLIEHFDRQGTSEAIISHFKLVRSGGLVLLTFSHPTWLYRFTRSLSEFLGLWIFHDERPLGFDEVLRSFPDGTRILHKEIIWPIFLTQGVIAAIKS